jgi:hypothetical protein
MFCSKCFLWIYIVGKHKEWCWRSYTSGGALEFVVLVCQGLGTARAINVEKVIGSTVSTKKLTPKVGKCQFFCGNKICKIAWHSLYPFI